MVFAGLLLLWTASCQILWIIREVIIERKLQDEDYHEHLIVPNLHGLKIALNSTDTYQVIPYVKINWDFFLFISTWHVGIVIGSAIGAVLNKVISVKWVYVSVFLESVHY